MKDSSTASQKINLDHYWNHFAIESLIHGFNNFKLKSFFESRK